MHSLEERIARLEGMIGDSGFSDPFTQVDASGNVAYEFDGKVLASGGIEIYAGEDDTPPDERRIRWIRDTDGALVAEIIAYESVQDRYIEVRSEGEGGAGQDAFSRLIAENGGYLARLEAEATSTRAAVYAYAEKTGVQSSQVQIIHRSGTSDFLKLLTTANLRLVVGTDTLTWPGGADLSNGLNVAHGLGAVPVCGLVIANSQAGTGSVSVSIEGGLTSTNLATVRGRTVNAFNPSGASTTPFSWLAIG